MDQIHSCNSPNYQRKTEGNDAQYREAEAKNLEKTLKAQEITSGIDKWDRIKLQGCWTAKSKTK